MSLLSSSIGRVRCLADEEADHNMLQDLQLAAELGKTLLERNKELENCIKLHLCTIEDQAQEIEYMKKQTAALREVNDSRLKIYEQLEVSIQDLERANQRLALENSNEKKQTKSQCLTIDTLETRVDELQKKYDTLNKKYESLLREQQCKSHLQLDDDVVASSPNNRITISQCDGSTQNTAVSPRRSSPEEEAKIRQIASKDEDVTKLLQQLQEARSARSREQQKVTQLKEQLDTLLLEHTQMEEQLNTWKTKAQDMKNLQDEISTLEEVRRGQLCGRCLRGIDSRTHDELSVMLDTEEDDEISLAESLADSLRDADTTLQELNNKSALSEEDHVNNPYRVLVEKYEALLKVQQRRKPAAAGGCMSLQEELQMSGEFGNFNASLHSEMNDTMNGRSSSTLRSTKKRFAGTPTDFSEAETSSSGFSDETSNKCTQTEATRPGSLLCSIADGDDCRLSIYDDASFESRFHNTPEYRKIFNEIYEVLKRAAKATDEGTELPLLDEGSELLTPKAECMPSIGTFNDDAPSELTDDTRSVSSLAVSSVVSEPVFRVHTPVISSRKEHQQQQQQQQQQQEQQTQTTPDSKKSGEPALRALHNNSRRGQPLEYLSVQVRKKGSAKKSRRSSELPSAPDVIPTPNPRVAQLKGGSRRKFRPLTFTELSDGVVWNGHTAHFYPSSKPLKLGRLHQQNSRDAGAGSSQDYKPGTASEEVAKLRRLEMSYAEALQMPNKSKGTNRQRRNHHH